MQLPVIENASVSAPLDPARAAIARDLGTLVRGRVRVSRHERLLYSTDASMYQVEPIAVVEPLSEDEALRVVAYCAQHRVALLPRGGGTSLAGQCTNHAVVMDLSAFLRSTRELVRTPAGGSLWAQSGVVPDILNAELARAGTGLFFPPDPATTAQATIGGCIGNNAAGSRSIMYGRTVDSVLAIDAALPTGERVTFRRGAGRESPRALRLASEVARLTRAHERLIRERFPKTIRRNAGYALDMILAQLDAGIDEHELDLVPLLCGSEGTLAVTLGAQLKLWPVPRHKALVLASYDRVDAAIAAVVPILGTGVSAVELVDDVVIEAALNNLECRAYVGAFPTINDRPPTGVLYIEYQCASEAELQGKLASLRPLLGATPHRVVSDAAQMGDAWKLRKAGEPLLHGLPGHRKPITFVEDNAVPPERLGHFVREFRAIVGRAGTRAAFWAHASVGVLHVRPMLDPHDASDLQTLKRIAVEVADLARACGGVMSGEHGDGRVRGPLLERHFGPELCRAFAQVKQLFDPQGILNPGNIVGAGDIDSITQRTRIEPGEGTGHVTVPPVRTYFDYRDHEGFAHAVERCNGAGVCRKTTGGTMCPSYRATLDERHATRGRGNALRLAITGQFSRDAAGTPDWHDAGTIQTLDLCLSCKACKSECPSNVDIARLKAEYTAQRYAADNRVPLAALATGHVRVLNALGSLTPGLANRVSATPLARAIINRVMNIDPRRSLPLFSRSLYRAWGRDRSPARAGVKSVAIFADCFTTYNESAIGLAARRVLEALGYRVILPRHGCCGRSMISVGMLPQAIETIDATIEQLRPLIEDERVGAILFAEPSCLSAVRDDWLSLRCEAPMTLRRRLAEKSFLIEQFIERDWATHPDRAGTERLIAGARHRGEVLLHAHCHQKALWGAGSSGKLLTRLLGERAKVLDTGCCGMAGSFGFTQGKYDLSMRIGELTGRGEPGGGILPIARNASAATTLCATGTSCRHQIKDGTARHAIHPVQLLDELLGS